MKFFKYQYWQQIFPGDFLLRLISLGLAIILWYFVGGEDIVNKNVMVPVEVINLPRDLVISNQFKKEIEVSVTGPRSLVLDMGKGDITRQIDLAQATPGTMVLENSNDVIAVPRGVKVLRIQPKNVILSLDKMIQKQFVINPVTRGDLAPDYILKNIRMEPRSISITGPQTVLSQYEVLRTKPIELQGLRKSTEIQVPLELDPVIVDLIGATTITAGLEISVETIQQTILGLVVRVEEDGVEQRVTPATVDVTAAFPKTLIRAGVDLQNLFEVSAEGKKENGQMQVKVVVIQKTADPVQILKIDPVTVMLIDDGKKILPKETKETIQ